MADKSAPFSLTDDEFNDPTYDPSSDTTTINATYGEAGSNADFTPDQAAPVLPTPVASPSSLPAHSPTAISIPAEDFDKSPFELNPDITKTAPIIGYAFDKKPVLDAQNTTGVDRLLTQLLFDNADEKADFLKQRLGKDYLFDVDPENSTNVVVKKKGTTYWGRVDPGLNQDSLLAEVGDNLDGIAQVLGTTTGPLSSALMSGGIEGLRQFVKTQFSDKADFSGTSVGIAAGAGLVGGKMGKIMNPDLQAAKGLLQNAGKNKTARGILGRIKDKAAFFNSDTFIAQELGATGDQMDDFAKEAITSNIGYLRKEHPDFVAAINNNGSLAEKKVALVKMLDDTGQRLGTFYDDPKNVVKVSDILDDMNSHAIHEAATTGRVKEGLQTVMTDAVTQAKAAAIQKDTLLRMAKQILPPKSMYLKAFKEGKDKLMNFPSIKKMGFNSDNEAMAFLLKDREMTAAQAKEVYSGLNEAMSYGKKKEALKAVHSLRKAAVDSMRAGITKSAERTGNQAFIKDVKLFHELYPVAKMTSAAAAAESAVTPNPFKVLAGTVNSPARRVVITARNLANRSDVRSALRRNVNSSFTMPKMGAFPSIASFVTKKAVAGASLLNAKALGKRIFLPRDSSAYFNDPQLINEMSAQVQDPELVDTLSRKLDVGDKAGFTNVLSAVAVQFPDAFAPSQYNSMVQGPDGTPVITDKFEREAHRKFIEDNVTDPKDKLRQLKALNMANKMIVAPYEIPLKPNLKDNILLTGKGNSTVSRVAASLKDSELTDLGNDEERQDYDY